MHTAVKISSSLKQAAVGGTSSAYVQDERYFGIEHGDVRREAFEFCTAQGNPAPFASSKAAPSYRCYV